MMRWTRPVWDNCLRKALGLEPIDCEVCGRPATVEVAGTIHCEPTSMDWSGRCDGHIPSDEDDFRSWMHPVDLAIDELVQRYDPLR